MKFKISQFGGTKKVRGKHLAKGPNASSTKRSKKIQPIKMRYDIPLPEFGRKFLR
jgi:hypothetical protein